MSELPTNIATHQADYACVIQITDTHLLLDPHARFVGMNPEQSFHAVMQQLLQRHPFIDAIIHTGDLAQEAAPATYARYLAFMQQFGIPFFQVPGNHDQQAHFPFSQTAPQHPLRCQIGVWDVMLLNTAVAGRVDGEMSTAQCEALHDLLQQSKTRPTLIACHHHPMLMQSAWIDQHRLKNEYNLWQVLGNAPQVKALVCGHVHQDSAQMWQHIACLSTPSTCVQFKPKSTQFALDAAPAGYRVLKLYTDGTWHSQVERLSELPEGLQHGSLGY